jgi:biopolymer transport protein ExbB/TolQ
MNIGAWLTTAIYVISTSLLYPTLFLLLGSFVWIILAAGGFCAEWLGRVRLKRCRPEDLPALIAGGEEGPLISQRVRSYIRHFKEMREQGALSDPQIENLIQDASLRLWKSADPLRILIRWGPSLGLMGTLIPMGTGLAALGQGDMTRLSSDLVIAFTTTVVGLAIGMAAQFFYTVKRRWIEEDVKNMELATEVLAGNRAQVQE